MNIRIAYFGIGKSNTYLALKEGILNKGYEQTSDFTFKNDKNDYCPFVICDVNCRNSRSR